MSLAEKMIGGFERCKRTAYPDSRGFLTIAIGCLVDPRVKGAGLCDAAIDAQFAHDSANAISLARALPNYDKGNDVQRAVLESMCFQLGSLAGWHDFRAALAIPDWKAAAAAALDSRWETETSTRARQEAWMLEHGIWWEPYTPGPPEIPT